MRFALVAVTLSTSALFAAAPTPPAASTPPTPGVAASAPATASAPAASAQETAARKALGDFFHAMFSGDQKAAVAFLTYSDLDEKMKPKAQAVAEAMFGEILAEQRLRMAVNVALGDKGKAFDMGMGPEEIAEFDKEVAGATVKVDDKTNIANIQMGPGPTFVVVLKDNKWMVDFDKTQSNMGPMPQGAELVSLGKKIAGYDQLAKEVADKKYGTLEEITRQIDKIDADADAKPPESQPATPAATAPAKP